MRNSIVSDSAPNNRPLAGLRVIDIATYIAAPYCATIMAEFGAEVLGKDIFDAAEVRRRKREVRDLLRFGLVAQGG